MSRRIPEACAGLAALGLLVACVADPVDHPIDLCVRSDAQGIEEAIAGGVYRLTLRATDGDVLDVAEIPAAGGDPVTFEGTGAAATVEVEALDAAGDPVAHGVGAFVEGGATCACVARDTTYPMVCADVVCRYEQGECRYFEVSGEPVGSRIIRLGENEADLVRGVTTDTEIRSVAADDNFGAHTSIGAGLPYDLVGLLRFDLSGLPPEATIEEANLELVVDDPAEEATDLALHLVTEAWDEGTSDGAAGCASWSCRRDGTAWTVEGCGFQSQSVRSREEEPALTETVEPADDLRLRLDVGALAPGWLARPEENFGLALLGVPSLRVVSSEGTDGSRPTLELRVSLR